MSPTGSFAARNEGRRLGGARTYPAASPSSARERRRIPGGPGASRPAHQAAFCRCFFVARRDWLRSARPWRRRRCAGCARKFRLTPTIVAFNRHVESIDRDSAGKIRHHYVIASFAGEWIEEKRQTWAGSGGNRLG